MNMKTVIILGLIFLSNQVFAFNVDKETLANDNARARMIEALKKQNSLNCKSNDYNCRVQYVEQARDKYPSRGLNYAKKKYSNFSTSQAFKRLAQLAPVYESAEDSSSIEKGKGMVRKEDILTEGWYIFHNILNFDEKTAEFAYFYGNKARRTKGVMPSPFIDQNCNMLIESERKLQVSIKKSCPNTSVQNDSSNKSKKRRVIEPTVKKTKESSNKVNDAVETFRKFTGLFTK